MREPRPSPAPFFRRPCSQPNTSHQFRTIRFSVLMVDRRKDRLPPGVKSGGIMGITVSVANLVDLVANRERQRRKKFSGKTGGKLRCIWRNYNAMPSAADNALFQVRFSFDFNLSAFYFINIHLVNVRTESCINKQHWYHKTFVTPLVNNSVKFLRTAPSIFAAYPLFYFP